MGKREEIIKLGIDIAKNTVPTQYSGLNADEALRNGFKELMGVSKDGVIDARVMRRSGAEVFEILEEVLDVVLDNSLRDELDSLVEYRNVKLGDTIQFNIPRKNIYKVAIISDGNGNMRRQRVVGGEHLTISTSIYGVKIYEEWSRFMAGRIDWLGMIRDVAESFALDVKNRIYNTLVNHFQEAGADNEYRQTISGRVPTEREILTMAKHIEAKTGQGVTIYGTALALNQLELTQASDEDLRNRNRQGYLATIAGIPTKEIRPTHVAGTNEFETDDNFIILVPEGGDRMIKVVNEGQSFILEASATESVDRTMEYEVINKFGISIVPTSQFGYIKFEA